MTNEILSSNCYSSKWQDLLYKCHSLFTTADPTKGHQGAGSLSQLAWGKPQCTLRRTRRFTAGLTCEDKQPHTLGWRTRREPTQLRGEHTERPQPNWESNLALCIFSSIKSLSHYAVGFVCMQTNIYMSSRSVKNVVVLVDKSFAYISFLKKRGKKLFSLPLLLGQDRNCEQKSPTSDCRVEISRSVSGDIYMLLSVALQHYSQPFDPLFVWDTLIWVIKVLAV